MRVALQQIAAERYAVDELAHPVGHVVHAQQSPQRVGDGRECGHVRRQVLRGVLEDVLDAAALGPVHERRGADRADVGTLEQDLSLGGVEQPRDEAPERALA